MTITSTWSRETSLRRVRHTGMKDSNEIENSGELNLRFDNFAAYILDALDDEEERAAVEALVEADSAARAEFDELTEAATLLAIAVPPVAPPASLKERIL